MLWLGLGSARLRGRRAFSSLGRLLLLPTRVMLRIYWVLIFSRRAKHSKQRKNSSAHSFSNYFHIRNPLPKSLHIVHPPLQEIPSGEPPFALVSEHKQLSGCIGAIEEQSFAIVVIICGSIPTSTPNLIAVAPQQLFWVRIHYLFG